MTDLFEVRTLLTREQVDAVIEATRIDQIVVNERVGSADWVIASRAFRRAVLDQFGPDEPEVKHGCVLRDGLSGGAYNCTGVTAQSAVVVDNGTGGFGEMLVPLSDIGAGRRWRVAQ